MLQFGAEMDSVSLVNASLSLKPNCSVFFLFFIFFRIVVFEYFVTRVGQTGVCQQLAVGLVLKL